jgi:hypothetical protein
MQRLDNLNQQKEAISSSFQDRQVDSLALNATYPWYRNGMKSVFLQDSNTLIVHPHNLKI